MAAATSGTELEKKERLEHEQLMRRGGESIMGSLERSMAILGESGKYAIYYVMKSEFHLDSDEIPGNATAFVKVLRKIFGIGAKVLEERILDELQVSESDTGEVNGFVRDFASVLESDLYSQLTEASDNGQ